MTFYVDTFDITGLFDELILQGFVLKFKNDINPTSIFNIVFIDIKSIGLVDEAIDHGALGVS